MTVLTLWTIRPKLMGIRGVANVAIWGQRDRQFQVLVDPDRLRAEGVTLDQVTAAARDAAVLESGGYIDKPNQRLSVRHRSNVQAPEDLGRAVVAFQGNAPIRLGDVTDVRIGSPPPIGDAIIVARPKEGEPPAAGTPGLLLIVEKTPDANTLEVTRQVEAALKELEPALTRRRGRSVDLPPRHLRRARGREPRPRPARRLRAGRRHPGLFLFDWRTALISLTAIRCRWSPPSSPSPHSASP
jgi:multidrug efflux pump subunit AcrB